MVNRMEGFIDIKKLNLQELVGVVNIYPWFSQARKELCERMSKLGDWGMSQYAEAAMYMSDRKVLARLLRKVEGEDYSDSNISEVTAEEPSVQSTAPVAPQVIVAGGDYFSRDQYEQVRHDDDGIYASYAIPSSKDEGETVAKEQKAEYEFCTETLAQIYAEQGYYQQAKDIYSKLILAYPEKNVYFAALIQKLEVENQK